MTPGNSDGSLLYPGGGRFPHGVPHPHLRLLLGFRLLDYDLSFVSIHRERSLVTHEGLENAFTTLRPARLRALGAADEVERPALSPQGFGSLGTGSVRR